MLDWEGIQEQWNKDCDEHFNDGKSDICPACKNEYKDCACGHEGDEPNW